MKAAGWPTARLVPARPRSWLHPRVATGASTDNATELFIAPFGLPFGAFFRARTSGPWPSGCGPFFMHRLAALASLTTSTSAWSGRARGENQHHAEPCGTIRHRLVCDTYRLRVMRETMGGARCRSETHAAARVETRSSAACVRSASRAGYAGFPSTRRCRQATRLPSSWTSWCP